MATYRVYDRETFELLHIETIDKGDVKSLLNSGQIQSAMWHYNRGMLGGILAIDFYSTCNPVSIEIQQDDKEALAMVALYSDYHTLLKPVVEHRFFKEGI